MSNYNPYNYPHQQSSAPQYSTYPTAPPANPGSQSSRQYQTAQPVTTTQPLDYMPYSTIYARQRGSYIGGQQGNTWGTNYGGNRETTNRAAEVLRNMSNTSYVPNTTATAIPGFTATNNAPAQSARYSTTTTQQSQQSHSYGQSQSRPRSVNANRGLPSPVPVASHSPQRASQEMHTQHQRPGSPSQHNHNSATPVGAARSATITATEQYNDYSHRRTPSVDTPRTQNTAVSTSYHCRDAQAPSPAPPLPSTTNHASHYSELTTTVDPTAVYDAWPEYQKQLEARRAQKAVEDADRAEERKAEDARRKKERTEEEERKALEEQEQMRQAAEAERNAATQVTNTRGSGASSDHSTELESQIRAMMAKMREINSKDPALLARIWEEERKPKAHKSPTAQTKPAPQFAPVQPIQAAAQPSANQGKGAVPKVAPKPRVATHANSTSSTQVQPAPIPRPLSAAAPARPAGNTVWPPEKRAHLANAASTYLNGQNPTRSLTTHDILSMLDGNPSYIELCEQLEGLGLKLDRAAFAKNLLNAVPDINPTSRIQTRPIQSHIALNAPIARRVQAPPPAAVPKIEVVTPAAPSPQYTPAAATPINGPSYPPSASHSPAPVAEMVPIKPELKPPANKEQAARKRNFHDLIDLTLLDEDEGLPPPKKPHIYPIYSHTSPGPKVNAHNVMDTDRDTPVVNNFNVPASAPPPKLAEESTQISVPPELRHRVVVQSMERKNALRRSTYNPKTIARDVLLACGRHPQSRPLNAHLDVLKQHLPQQIPNDADLSTLNWDLLDPGRPPPGYYKDNIQASMEDADDEDESDEGVERAQPKSQTGGNDSSSVKAQAPLSEATNPFKTKRRGRPPRHSFPSISTSPTTPLRETSSASMSASAPRPSAPSVGYSAFRIATEYGPDGKPLPKKKGRPVGWRKAIHGSAASQARPNANGHTGPLNKHLPSQPSGLRNVKNGLDDPIRIDSRSPSAVLNTMPRFQPFKCKWQNCQAELHNLETLKKHVHKVHSKETIHGTLECLWGNCGKEVIVDPVTHMTLEKRESQVFRDNVRWRKHIQDEHFSPLSWELGDGPASGLSDANDSEAYLSDAQSRRVTPRIIANSEHIQEDESGACSESAYPKPPPARQGRPLNTSLENEARDAHSRMLSQKKRVGGPGMDRGGAVLANAKRRKGFSNNDDTEEELVDAEG